MTLAARMPRHVAIARACWRLGRAAVHALHGGLICAIVFPFLDDPARMRRVGWWARRMLEVMGIGLQVEGVARPGGALLVANHVSWLDITALHAVVPQARFVSKADIQSWPLLSRLADAADTLYLQRERKRDALRVVHLVAQALSERQTVAVFPEGTTSDGRSLLPFHANILQAAISTDTPVQPVALRFSDACSRISPAVEFIGATTLVESLWRVACADGLVAHVALLPARACTHADRRALAQTLRDDIETRLQGAD
jgi:1-acyl-sn-glycerol-3-phosphate acyltransferase